MQTTEYNETTENYTTKQLCIDFDFCIFVVLVLFLDFVGVYIFLMLLYVVQTVSVFLFFCFSDLLFMYFFLTTFSIVLFIILSLLFQLVLYVLVFEVPFIFERIFCFRVNLFIHCQSNSKRKYEWKSRQRNCAELPYTFAFSRRFVYAFIRRFWQT